VTETINSTNQALVYQGTVITQRQEMLSLTDMWKAAGSPEGRRPDDWKKDAAHREFLDHVAMVANAPVEGIWKGTRGRIGGGTIAHWQIGLAYAKYLSPEFHMWCNTVVRERMEGKLTPAHVSVAALEAQVIRTMGGVIKGIVNKALSERFAPLSDIAIRLQRLEDGYDPRVTVTDFVPMLDVLKSEGVMPKRRRSLSQRCSRDCLRFCIQRERRHAFRLSRETGRYLFQQEAVHEWLRHGGAQMISSHKAVVAGQTVLPFPKKPGRSK